MEKNDVVVVVIMKQRTYMTVKDMAKWYGVSAQTIRKNVEQMMSLKRYEPKNHIVLDKDGKWLVNSLMYEDYLANKAAINAGIKKLAPYDPEEVSRERGEYKVAI